MYYLSEEEKKYWLDPQYALTRKIFRLETKILYPMSPENVFPTLRELFLLQSERAKMEAAFELWYKEYHPCEEHRQHDGEHCELCLRWLGHCTEFDPD